MSAFTVEVQGVEEAMARLATISRYTADTYDWGKVIADEAVTVLNSAVKTWKHKPTFHTRGTRGSFTTTLAIMPEPALPFGYVNAGTRPHMIFPKKPGGVLAFNLRFRAKSRPNSLAAFVGFSGPPVRFAKGVHHPGSAARNFEKLASEKAGRDGGAKVRKAIQALIEGTSAFWTRAAVKVNPWR